MSDTDTVVSEVSDDVRQNREDEAFIAEFVKKLPDQQSGEESETKPVSKVEKEQEVTTEKKTVAKTPVADESEHRADPLDSEDDKTVLADDEEGAEGAAEGEEPDEESPDDATRKDAAKDFATALEEHGVSFTKLLADVPAEYRPLLEKKAKELQAGFTRARQADREQFKDSIALRAEMRLLKERPADVIVEQILKTPALAEQINAKLDQLDKMDQLDGKPGSAAGAHAETVKRARATAVTAEQAAATQADTEARRIDAITAAGMRAARVAGVPFQAGVEDAIAAQLALGHLDITMDEITKIAQEKAAVWERSTRAVKREASKDYAKQKAKDRRTAGLAIRPGAGASAVPASKGGPANDDEFVAYMRDKY